MKINKQLWVFGLFLWIELLLITLLSHFYIGRFDQKSMRLIINIFACGLFILSGRYINKKHLIIYILLFIILAINKETRWSEGFADGPSIAPIIIGLAEAVTLSAYLKYRKGIKALKNDEAGQELVEKGE